MIGRILVLVGDALKIARVHETAKTPKFGFRDATDLDPSSEAHVTEISFDMSNKDEVIRSEAYRKAGENEASEMRLVRDK